jgi:RNA polymerase sigma-70 factor (ECF subfamily)
MSNGSEIGGPPGPPVVALEPDALWAEFSPPLRAFLARRVPPGVEPDDLLQDVFLRVVRHLDTLRATDRPEAWLFQVARNAVTDSLRARLRRDGRTDALEDDIEAAPDGADVPAAQAELAPCLTAMIGRLAEPYRSAIALTSIEGLTQAEAAKQAGVSVSGMKSRVQRGREQLRQMLVRCCEIAVDARGGVSDFHLRSAGACVQSEGAASSGSNRAVRSDSEELTMTTAVASVAVPPSAPSILMPSGCCGGPAPADSGACCVADAEVKATGGDGCGCGAAKPAATPKPAGGCCSR